MSNDQYHLALNIPCYLPIWISYKTRKATTKYSCYYIYIHVTHVRLDIALMEGDLYPLWFLKNIIWMHLASKNRLYFLQKNCLSTKPTNICTAQWSINLNFIQNFKTSKKKKRRKKKAFMICLCYSHMFRCSYKN